MLNTFQKKRPEVMDAKIILTEVGVSMDRTSRTCPKLIVSDIH